MSKSLKQRIKQAKSLTIQKLQNTINHKMVYMYFKNNLVQDYIERFGVVAKDGIIKITFNNPQNARKFVQHSNFKDKILLRPFNIYFNIQAKQHERQDFKIIGVTEQNQRKIYEIGSKYGLVKLNTNYSYKGTLLTQAIISIVRQTQLREEEQQDFKKLLHQIQVQLIPRKNNKKEVVPQNKLLAICKQQINQIYQDSLQALRQFQQRILTKIAQRRKLIHQQFKNIENDLTLKAVQDISIHLQKNKKKCHSNLKNQMKAQENKINWKIINFLQNIEDRKSLFQFILTDQIKRSEQYINLQLEDMNKFIFSTFQKQFGLQKKKELKKQQKKEVYREKIQKEELIKIKQPQISKNYLFQYNQKYVSQPQDSDDQDNDPQFEYQEDDDKNGSYQSDNDW